MRRDCTARVDNGDSEDYRRRPRVMHLYYGNSCTPAPSFPNSQYGGRVFWCELSAVPSLMNNIQRNSNGNFKDQVNKSRKSFFATSNHKCDEQ